MTQLRPAEEADRELLRNMFNLMHACLLYTSDAADEL